LFTIKHNTHCRYCGGELFPVADFKLPAPNVFYPSPTLARMAPVYDLPLSQCGQCASLSVPEVQSGKELFEAYTFRSGVTDTFKKHCRAFAETVKKHLPANVGRGVAIDIAGNDGTLARAIADACDLMPVVFDPAKNIIPLAQSNGCAIMSEFWGKASAEAWRRVESEIGRYAGGADVITATNVLAHVPDPLDFIAGVKSALSVGGVFVVEFPYLVSFLSECQWDTVYPEHLGYLSFSAVHALLHRNGLTVVDVVEAPIHGGSMRIYAKHTGEGVPFHGSTLYLGMEREYTNAGRRTAFASIMQSDIERVKAHAQAGPFVGFGAAAKSSVINSMAGVAPEYIIDETPEKIGRFQGVSGSLVRSPSAASLDLQSGRVTTVFNYAWNYAAEAEKKLRAIGFCGHIVDVRTGRVQQGAL
jgi:hypothetical protein